MAKVKSKKLIDGNTQIDHDDAISFERICAIYGKSMRTLNRWRHEGLWSFKSGKDRFTTHQKLSEFFLAQEKKRSA